MNTPAPITVRPLLRPTFDNAHLRSFEFWRAENLPQLATYFVEVCKAEPFGARFNRWALCQWDIERFKQADISATELARELAL